MLTRLFVGVTYSNDNALARKIEGFKRRFDSKFLSNQHPHMSLLAPFDIRPEDKINLVQELQEEVEAFFYGQNGPPKLGFLGLDVHQGHKKNILHLNPNFSDDLLHCMESVSEICQSFVPKGVKYRQNAKQFLPLGSFQKFSALEEVLDLAKGEFTSNGQLSITGIVVFEKKYGMWQPIHELIRFDESEEQRQQFHHAQT